MMILIDCSIFSIKLQINTRHYLLYESNCGIFSKPFMRNFSLKKTCCLATNIQLLYSQHCDRCWPSTIMSWWRHQMDTFSALLALTKVSDTELWCFLRWEPEQTVKHTVELSVIWDAMKSMWRRRNVPHHVQAILTNFAFLYIYIYIYIFSTSTIRFIKYYISTPHQALWSLQAKNDGFMMMIFTWKRKWAGTLGRSLLGLFCVMCLLRPSTSL